MRTGVHSAPKRGFFHVRRDNPVSIYLVAIICGLLAFVLGGASCYMYAHGEAVNKFLLRDPEPQAFAVVSEDDGSLRFYKRAGVPTAGSTFDGRTVTAVYTGLEDEDFGSSEPWYEHYEKIRTVTTEDAGIAPKSMNSWFAYLDYVTSIDLTGFDTSQVDDISYLFYYCPVLTEVKGIPTLDTSRVTTLECLFEGCSALSTIDVSSFDTSNVTDMQLAFAGCSSLTDLDLSQWDTSKVTNMYGMFHECHALADVTLFAGTSSVTSMGSMFYGCDALTTLDLSSFDTGNVNNIDGMFWECSSLVTIYAGSGWSMASVTSGKSTFNGCDAIVGGLGTVHDAVKGVNYDYAHVDAGPDNPGYLTPKIVVNYRSNDGQIGLTEPYCFGLTTPTNPEEGITGWSTALDGSGRTYDLGERISYDPASIADIDLYAVHGFAVYSADDNSLCFYKRAVLPAAGETYEGKAATAVYTGIETSSYTDSTLPWKNYRSSVTNVSIVDDGISPTSTAYWFNYMSNCKVIDVNKLDTSQTRNMSHMFFYCSNLPAVDVSSFDTSKAIDMSYMFQNCSALSAVDVSNFDTSQVTDMSGMFYNCSILTSIDVGTWNTSKVTNMGGMFSNCPTLTSIDVGTWDTSKVTNMANMFRGCKALTTLDVSTFDTSQVISMSQMFENCSVLATLDVSGFDTSKVTSMQRMFYGCSGLTTLDVSNFDTSKVTSMGSMFCFCSNVVTIYAGDGWATDAVTNGYNMFSGCTSLVGGAGTIYSPGHKDADYAQVDGKDGNPGYLTPKISVAYHDSEGNVTETIPYVYGVVAHDAPSGCVGWTTTADVTEVVYVAGDLVAYDTNNITDIDLYPVKDNRQAFAVYSDDDNSLNFYKRSSVPAAGETFEGKAATAVYTGIETASYSESTIPWRDYQTTITRITVVDEGLTPVSTAWWFYRFANCISLDVTRLNTSRVTNMTAMFCYCSKLTSLDLSSFDTSKVSNMGVMFQGCSSLSALDVTSFDTSQVTTMGNMFNGCSKLTALDVTGFDTSEVTSMARMFWECSSLTSLDVSEFDTSKATNLSYMFYYCSSLTSLDLSSFDTSKSTNLTGMFSYCSNLTTIYAGDKWTTDAVTSSSSMFTNCLKLTGGNGTVFDGSHLDASYAHIDSGDSDSGYLTPKIDVVYHDSEGNVTETVPYVYGVTAKDAPAGCAGWATSADATEAKYVAGDIVTYDAANIADIDLYPVKDNRQAFAVYSADDNSLNFYKRSSVPAAGDTFEGKAATAVYTGIEILKYNSSTIPWKSFQTSINSVSVIDEGVSPLSTSYWFSSLSNCTSADIAKLDTSQVTDMSWMFYKTAKLATVDVSQFDTSKTISMASMFSNCSALNHIDVTNWNTTNVTNMSSMFTRCSNLVSLDLSGFVTSKVTNMMSMFSNCSKLTALDLSGFDTSAVASMKGMFTFCSALKQIELSQFDLSNVTDLSSLFFGCSALSSIDLSGWNTSSIVNMTALFSSCSSLSVIYVGDGWSTTNITSSTSMFANCTKLVGGTGTKFSSSHLDAAYAHVDGGTSNPGYLTYKATNADDAASVPILSAQSVTENGHSPIQAETEDNQPNMNAKTEEAESDLSPTAGATVTGE